LKDDFDLAQYLSDGIEHIVKQAIRMTVKNPQESAFLLRYSASAKDAEKRRHAHNTQNDAHIPPFLIAGISADCNLHCAGCYARASEKHDASAMATADWGRLFSEAKTLGIAMILLAGGEPLLRLDVIEEAAKHPEILFPVFSNGTLLDDRYLRLFENHRNLVPLLSIEGDETQTDARRGDGVYRHVTTLMQNLQAHNVLFGASITVTTQNLDTVLSRAYVSDMKQKGVQVIVFVEYVPFENTELALDKTGQARLRTGIEALRSAETGILLISFPGDESYSGGCLAAGRGFFYINPTGGAEPCPFSPYSDTNLRTTTLRDALKSPLFSKLRDLHILSEEHNGACLLFEREDTVRLLAESSIGVE
jgi:MoaA/NifB/PqqE/SkfB family radical SAM enzyme